MGTYIIHFDDKPWEDLDDEQYYRCKEIPWFSTTKTTISRLTPYTEPEPHTEVTADAYQRGYENGFIAGHLKAEKSGQSFYEDGYRCGLNDAWECMKKIAFNPESVECVDDLVRMGFDVGTADSWSEAIELLFEKYSASECIEKIRQYEQEKDRQVRIEYNFDEIKDVLETTVKECNVSLDEIAEVLQKMKEANNG